MNPKVIGGIVVVIAAAVVAYFLFFSGGKCSQSAMEELAPKMQEAVTKLVQSDPTKAEEIIKKAQEIAAKGEAGDVEAACELTYALAKELGVATE